jgi:hypothetical protein
VSTSVFVYMSDVELCLDSVKVCFDVIFWVTFINRNMCHWNYCGRCDVSCVSLLFCREVGIDNIYKMFVLSSRVVLGK